MKKQALSDEILLSVEKPARYVGNEKNAVLKDKNSVDIRFAMCFPDVYEIGMSHLGIQIIYEQMNRRNDTWCERVYSPWPDLMKVMKDRKIPLFALESQDPVKDFDILGITLQFELCYTNVLQVLDLSGIPISAAERTEADPIVIGGGPCTYNPEPIAEFFDIFAIGESEAELDALLDLYKTCKANHVPRKEFLKQAASLPGMYVPMFYEVTYHEDGTLASFAPAEEGIPNTVQRQICSDFTGSPYPTAPIVPYIRATQDRVTLEIMRGCIRGCRFCQAGMVYRPLREKKLDTLKEYADCMIAATGWEELSLSSLSSSDYSKLPELLDYLIKNFHENHVNVSLPSLRIDNFSLDVMNKVQDIRKSSLTFAPEGGTQRMRDVINKGLTEEDILGGAAEAFKGGWNKVKLYFMLGQPTETEEDRKGIAHLAQAICDTYYELPKEERNGKCEINVSTSFFVPKPFTPFQWATMSRKEDYLSYARTVKSEIREMKNQKSIRYNWHEAEGTVLEGVFARGDRRVSSAIRYAYEHGAIFDAWGDFYRPEIWAEAFQETGVDPEFYNLRARSTDELLPWDFIDIGVTKQFLIREWERAHEAKVTPNCREACSGCGAAKYGCGICKEKRG